MDSDRQLCDQACSLASGLPLASEHDQFGVRFTEVTQFPGDVHAGRLPYLPWHGLRNFPFEPDFIRKRNERERQRVRCVNAGYARLRAHLPLELANRRLSKVETLRAAIAYIKHLQQGLELSPARAEGSGFLSRGAGGIHGIHSPCPSDSDEEST
uniref:Achaete-scute family bHLH transcription factor 4 n=1 Tax=Callorhinchus milii TaxID=7868 RepID=A0A4W3IJE2_CALMI